MSFTNNVAGGLVSGVVVQQAGANATIDGFSATGSWSSGINFQAATLGIAAMKVPNAAAAVVARNSTNTADVAILYLDATNFVRMDSDLVLNFTNPYVQLGSNAAGWLYQKIDADNRLRFFKQGVGEAFFTDNAMNIVQFSPTGDPVGTAAALAVSATNGFIYINAMAGAPTGTPTNYPFKVPIVYDSINDVLKINNNGTWKSINAIDPFRITLTTGTGFTVNEAGRFARTTSKTTVTNAAFTCAALTCDVTIATLPAKTRLVSINRRHYAGVLQAEQSPPLR